MSDPTKLRRGLVPPEWDQALAADLQSGLGVIPGRPQRQAGDWLEACKKDPDVFLDALLRHLDKARENAHPRDQCEHWVAVACNALIQMSAIADKCGIMMDELFADSRMPPPPDNNIPPDMVHKWVRKGIVEPPKGYCPKCKNASHVCACGEPPDNEVPEYRSTT